MSLRSLPSLPSLDDLDRKIVVLLQQDGRASWTAIAEAVGSSVATVSRRGQQLLTRGAVRVAVVPALGSAGPESTFLVRITCRTGTAIRTAGELAALDDVRFLSLVTGDCDILACSSTLKRLLQQSMRFRSK